MCGADPGSIIIVTELYWSQCCVTSTCCRFTLKLTSSVPTSWIYTLYMSDALHFSFFQKQSCRKEKWQCLFKKKQQASKRKKKKQGSIRFKHTLYPCELMGQIYIATYLWLACCYIIWSNVQVGYGKTGRWGILFKFGSDMLSQIFKLKIFLKQDRSLLRPIMPFHKNTTKYYLTLH